jgi:hypothetical protein
VDREIQRDGQVGHDSNRFVRASEASLGAIVAYP